MNEIIAGALYSYFETLYNLNRNLITFCGVYGSGDSWTYHKYIHDVICDIPRLIPYACSRSKHQYTLASRDGLLEYTDELPYLLDGYESILLRHYCFLERLKLVRNKFEHRMHDVTLTQAGSGSCIIFDLLYEIAGKPLKLNAHEFIACAKDLNILFSKIQNDLGKYAYQENKNASLYCQRLLRYDFEDFNKIYDSGLLRSIGKAFLPF